MPEDSPIRSVRDLAGKLIATEAVEMTHEVIPQLKALGAEGIIEYPLNKVVY